jgi:hypothetical protein
MFRVTVDGDWQEWFTMELALTDALTRGFGKSWTIERSKP